MASVNFLELLPLFESNALQAQISIETTTVRTLTQRMVGDLDCKHLVGLLGVGYDGFEGLDDFVQAVTETPWLRSTSADAHDDIHLPFGFVVLNPFREQDSNRIVVMECPITICLWPHAKGDRIEEQQSR